MVLLPANNRRVALQIRIPAYGQTIAPYVGTVFWDTDGTIDPVTGVVDTTSTIIAASFSLAIAQPGGLFVFLGREADRQLASAIAPDGGHLSFFLERHGGAIFQEVWIDANNPLISSTGLRIEVHESISSGPIGDNY